MNRHKITNTSPILTSRDLQLVTRSIKENLYSFFRRLHDVMPPEFNANQGLVAWKTNIPHPWFNAVLSVLPPGEDASQVIEQALAWFLSRQVSAISWWLSSEVESTGWETLLLSKNFVKDSNTPGMAVALDRLVSLQSITGFEIQLVRDHAALDTWADTFCKGYGIPEDWLPALTEMIASLGLELPISNYLGYLEGEPVAASTRFLGAGVAGIYNVATIETARGKGIGSLMTAIPLLEARQMGYHWGILQSSQMGLGVYQRLGFEKLCDMDHFYCET
jgi:GNAT superfamily N-acetyltransferase